MAKKKEPVKPKDNPNIEGLQAVVMEQPITNTLELNFMPYAMSVILSRAIPEIDGFKPSHRKLLYTMYKMGLLNGNRTKSANIVGQTMRLNPHGDGAIYETMVRLSRGYGALLHPFIDSKGNFGKSYSRDMAYAASRYTEAKLDPICTELFKEIDSDTVDFVDNYDATMLEPQLLPTTFPNVLVSANMGIAVGMASNICGFNLEEVCRTTIALIRNPDCDLMDNLPAPDFPTGGEYLYEQDALRTVYDTGRGSLKLRAKWRYLKEGNLIEIFEIPYTTTTEAIMDKVAELIKSGKIREISDMRDETDLSGLKLTIDLKRGVDPEKLMAKLFRTTTLLDSFSCNFNILIAGQPKVMGIREILTEWIAWRTECIRRRVYFEQHKQMERLHLLQGLSAILLDIDEAIRVIRETETEAEVIPNLMIGFGIDQLQAEYIAEIRLRNINREYILKRTQEISSLEEQIADANDILSQPKRVQKIIIKELETISKKYATPRQTSIVYDFDTTTTPEEPAPDYPVHVFLTREGYIKKITPQSLRMSGEQKLKEGDRLVQTVSASNRAELLVFTNLYQVYKARLQDFDDTKASALGDYLPAKLGMDEGETVVGVVFPQDYQGSLLFAYENGKCSKIALSCYATKTNRRRLTGAYSDKSPLQSILHLPTDRDLILFSSDGRALVCSSAQMSEKTTRASQGVQVFTLRRNRTLTNAMLLEDISLENVSRYRAKSLPAAGALLRPEDAAQPQLTMELLTPDG